MSSGSVFVSNGRAGEYESVTVPIRYRALADEADAWAAEYLRARADSTGEGSEDVHDGVF